MKYSEVPTLIIRDKKGGAGKCLNTDRPLTKIEREFQNG